MESGMETCIWKPQQPIKVWGFHKKRNFNPSNKLDDKKF
jgi:hypothetical protein